MKRALLIAAALAAVPLVTLAGRPLTVDDAGVIEPGNFQVEAGGRYVHNTGCRHFDFPLAVSCGVVPALQAGIGFGGQLEERAEAHGRRHTETEIGDLTLGAKWNPLPAERFWADHALALTLKLPTADDDKGLGSGKTDVDLTYILTRSLSEQFNVDFNLGYTWVGGDSDLVHYGLALRWQATERVELVGEVFADTPVAAGGDTVAAMNAGIRWKLADGWIFDAAAGAGLRGDAPDVTATAGLTWTFDIRCNRKKAS
jgi:hypothetical protein